MSEIPMTKVYEARRALKNQYAHVEYLYPEDFCGISKDGRKASTNEVIDARARSQNPYAFLDDVGSYSADALSADTDSNLRNAIRKSRRYSDRQIETKATKILTDLWTHRQDIWGERVSDPTVVIDPAKALEQLGFSLFYEEELGEYASDIGHVKIAASINSSEKTVHVSRRFPENVKSFTIAHELGHALLHNADGFFHRDRPLDGKGTSRVPMEIQADKFASFFLMPEKLVRARFAELFGVEQFALMESSAFALTCKPLSEVKKKCATRRNLSKLLAGAKYYNGEYIYSLAEQFKVSVQAMAIRLEELSLVK